MLQTTSDIISSALKADPTVPPAQRSKMIHALRHWDQAPTPDKPGPSNAPRLIRRTEAAARIGMSLRAFDRLCRQGLVSKRTLPGRKRASGVLESDLERLIEGRA